MAEVRIINSVSTRQLYQFSVNFILYLLVILLNICYFVIFCTV